MAGVFRSFDDGGTPPDGTVVPTQRKISRNSYGIPVLSILMSVSLQCFLICSCSCSAKVNSPSRHIQDLKCRSNPLELHHCPQYPQTSPSPASAFNNPPVSPDQPRPHRFCAFPIRPCLAPFRVSPRQPSPPKPPSMPGSKAHPRTRAAMIRIRGCPEIDRLISG